MCDYTITMDVPESFAESLQASKKQCYVEMADGQIIPVVVVPGNREANDPPAIVDIKVKWTMRATKKSRSVINRLKRIA